MKTHVVKTFDNGGRYEVVEVPDVTRMVMFAILGVGAVAVIAVIRAIVKWVT